MTTSIKATKANAISTLISGLAILGFQHQLMVMFEINETLPFIIVGGVITFFSLTMFMEIKKQRALALLWIVAQDTLFVLASIVILILQPFDISTTGYVIIGLFLLPILYFIKSQSKGIIQMDVIGHSGTKRLTFSRVVKASKNTVWDVITDIENYHEVASNIDKVEIVSGEGEGLVRSCSHGNDSWTETCTLWEDQNQYSFVVNTNAPDYPYPFKYLKGTWKVNETNTRETEIIMIFDFEFKKSYQKLLLYPMLKWKFSKVAQNLLKKWEKIIVK
ncbi:SRPBCC family protein [uncultured Maribacter sp.]|uniref:type II toxin-antitoxin system RatA family toxin n=1 Tax=uncultured Maribacter sp. TaxID=431308 RepID=UPI00261B562F|nr:SRPBCC family protein [uncultured Maribacter sp.]